MTLNEKKLLYGSLMLFAYLTLSKSLHNEEELEMLFRQRSQSDWKNVWHQETHSRCRDKIVRQLYWACEKDIYRLNRRNLNKREQLFRSKKVNYLADSFWLNPYASNQLLLTRRSRAPSITNECCTKIGCTWEEYAEYCPSNKRRNHY